MAEQKLKDKIENLLKRSTYFSRPNDLVEVSDGPGDSVHIVIVSHIFDGRRLKEKNDLIWSVLSQGLDSEEWGKISLSIGTSPEEIKAG